MLHGAVILDGVSYIVEFYRSLSAATRPLRDEFLQSCDACIYMISTTDANVEQNIATAKAELQLMRRTSNAWIFVFLLQNQAEGAAANVDDIEHHFSALARAVLRIQVSDASAAQRALKQLVAALRSKSKSNCTIN
jgi:hypothetical protein